MYNMYKACSLHPKVLKKNKMYFTYRRSLLIDAFWWACVWLERSAHIPGFNKSKMDNKINVKMTTNIIFNEFGANFFPSLTPTNTEVHKNPFWRGQEEIKYRWAQAWRWKIIIWHVLVINNQKDVGWESQECVPARPALLCTPPPAPGELWESDKVQDKSMKVCH